MRYDIGDVVRLKEDLIAGIKYYDEDSLYGDTLTLEMKRLMSNTEATVVRYDNGGYILDKDRVHTYYDEMLERPPDTLAESEYIFNLDLEKFIYAINVERGEELLDKALDERIFEKDPEYFKILVSSIENLKIGGN